MAEQITYKLITPIEFEVILKKLKQKKPDVLKILEKKIEKVLREPMLGKPLRNTLRNYRRVHVDPFVLLYEIRMLEVRLMDFDHHDKIYKKYKIL
ncbi:MAG: hypothetical protein UT54_C0033G0005 [Candidatus Daviesbacteria bacterium GW2011_GWB1_39_5]|uniref:Addiction module toxin RelE n=1 Tax=Candidatus Nomurabacteria bacterium RIFCSPLOWO2_02_FULL_40_67 TaxID=1801787 RepID=A0A1F6Y4C1_9BACT|nr:MAG: hypothetical protein UT54_C0033G0005 [Candidatus Daviesbacteria bacterium GW2011_GWB1_39_5]KKR62865.1 MAG: hypothetical protein UU01_C0002G0088 [Parcubacteria group bacterium GW2011_GWA2_40_37]KKS72896.1 MAG: hypothetical protein UV43_C0011G0009 [Parcubacteria group bacterium GW2011_GWF2_42_7]OGI62101.1 MAG: hypothetical protein A2W12_01965 [Candidatus Nomurabacteria bacterium RBG_16_40_11]OGI70316.1 MAG: hypothetical protein A2643_00830 [Candidatus Nomurabacteria bacterium RIFCSPHIGHO2